MTSPLRSADQNAATSHPRPAPIAAKAPASADFTLAAWASASTTPCWASRWRAARRAGLASLMKALKRIERPSRSGVIVTSTGISLPSRWRAIISRRRLRTWASEAVQAVVVAGALGGRNDRPRQLAADGHCGRPAEELLGRPVPGDDRPLGVDRDERVVRGLDDLVRIDGCRGPLHDVLIGIPAANLTVLPPDRGT